MSDSQAYEEVNVASDGVTVTKRFEEDEFPVPAIAFEFKSDRNEGVTVRLTDTVPDDIEVEDLGFHPEYGSEYWTIDDDVITFERDLDANSSYTTVYGIRATGSDDVQQFLAEPTLESVEPPLPDDTEHEDVIPESGDDVVKEAIAGDGEIPGLEEEDDEDDEDEDVGTLDLKDPNDSGGGGSQQAASQTEETQAETTEEADGTDGTADAAVTIDDDSLISAMATEIRQNNVSADDVKLLRQAFEIAAEEGGSTAAKIEQIQSDIADLRAYTNSLEEFLDDNGTAEEMIGEFEQQIEEFGDQLDSFESEIDSNTSQLNAMNEEVDSVSEEVSSVSEEISTVNDDVDTLDEEVSSVRREVNGLGNEFEEFESSIDEIEETVEDLREDVADGDVAGRIDDLEAEIDDLQVWQEQIKETFGG